MNPDRLQYAWMACKSSHPSGDYSVLDTSRERLLRDANQLIETLLETTSNLVAQSYMRL